LAFNLMNEVDVAETEAKIAAYENENKDSIAANQARMVNEQRFMNYQEELEKQQREQKREEYLQQLEEERKQKEHEKAEIIKELASSNKPAQAVLALRQTAALKRSSALRQQTDPQPSRLALPSWLTSAMDTNETEMKEVSFDPLALEYTYPQVQLKATYVDPATDYISTHKAARAGGYAARFAFQRGLSDAMTGLLCRPVYSEL
ncbi:CDK-activating kinase assembly factor MAT1-domain-containing protein, partial [Spinellus fusiger]